MAKHRIRITGHPGAESSGIFGKPTEKNPTGEYPLGYEFDTDAEFPEGWVGRAVIVGEGAADGSQFVTGAEPGPLDGSVDDLTAHLATVDDADEVQKLIDAETAGKSRKGALAALEARRDELLA